MKQLVNETRIARQAMGAVFLGPSEREKASLQFRRTLYVVQDVKAGEAFTPENVRAIRPGLGLPPRHYEDIIGKTATRDIARGTPFSWELLGLTTAPQT